MIDHRHVQFADRRAAMSRAMRTGALLVALIVLSTYWAGDASESGRYICAIA